MSKWIFSYFAVWFGGSFWWVSSRFIDSEIVPKWFFAMFGTAVFCVVCAVAAFLLPEIRRTGARFTAVSAAVLLCAASQAAYALLQWSGMCDSCGVFPACGSFDNPAGLASALAFSVPFGFYLAENSQGVLRKATWTAVVLVTAAVVASGSRSGMLAVCAVCLACLPTRWTSIRRPLALALLAVIAAASVFLYHYKKDSADGRLLIWQCTWELIKERPLAGHGPGGFQAHYMDAQADYFRAHPDSPYARLADDVKSPFNEYLGLLTDFGLAGGLVLAALVVLLFRAWRRHPVGSSRPAMLCLLAVAVFSLFSYPFRYAHTWLFCGLCATVSLRNAWPPSPTAWRWIAVPLAGCAVAASPAVLRRMQAEMRWCETANLSLCGRTEEVLPDYYELYGELKDEPLFLYNYAAELNVAGRYAQSLRVGRECEARMADYFTQLLQADNCRKLGRPVEAERHLEQAAHMCPNRFVPLHELYQLHEARADTPAMRRVAEAILRKPVKVDSPQVRVIIAKMKHQYSILKNN